MGEWSLTWELCCVFSCINQYQKAHNLSCHEELCGRSLLQLSKEIDKPYNCVICQREKNNEPLLLPDHALLLPDHALLFTLTGLI